MVTVKKADKTQMCSFCGNETTSTALSYSDATRTVNIPICPECLKELKNALISGVVEKAAESSVVDEDPFAHTQEAVYEVPVVPIAPVKPARKRATKKKSATKTAE